MAPDPKTNARRRFPAGLAWAIALLLVAEGLARWVWDPALVGEALYVRVDPTYGYGYELAHPICREDGDALVCRPTQYVRILAGQRVARTKPENGIRFVTVGGSHAFGGGSFPAHLAAMLGAACPGAAVEQVSFAVEGTGTSRHRVLLEEALRLEPDFVLASPEGTNEYEDERDARARDSLRAGVWRAVLASHAVVLAQKLAAEHLDLETRAAAETADDERTASRSRANLDRWDATQRRNLEAMTAATRAAGVPLYLVQRASASNPEGRRPVDPGALDPKARGRRIVDAFAGPEVFVIDADRVFPSDDTRAGHFRADRNHYSSRGHRRIAGALLPSVLEHVPAARRWCRAPNAAAVPPSGQ